MNISTYIDKNWDIIKISGAFITREQYKIGKLFKELTSVEVPKIAIDLSETTYLDSSAIGLLVTNSRITNDKDGQFIIYRPNENLKDMFDMVNLDAVMKISETLPE